MKTGESATYVSDVQFSPASWDLTLRFARYLPKPGTNDWNYAHQGAVALPWGLVKTLIYGLTICLVAYEKAYGPVIVSPQMIPQMPTVESVGTDGIARLAILHAELFHGQPSQSAPVTPAETSEPAVSSDDDESDAARQIH